jgi:hypothetical protein
MAATASATSRKAVARMIQLRQLPAPRGSPHAPQGIGASMRAELLDGALTANTDNCLSSCVLEHFGHSSFVDSRTSSSK